MLFSDEQINGVVGSSCKNTLAKKLYKHRHSAVHQSTPLPPPLWGVLAQKDISEWLVNFMSPRQLILSDSGM